MKQLRRIQLIILISMLVISLHGIDRVTVENEDSTQHLNLNNGLVEKVPPPNGKEIDEPTVLPFHGFVKNYGQVVNTEIEYYYSINGISVGFSLSEIFFVSNSETFSITFPNAEKVNPVGIKQQINYVNYFYADLQATNVPTYQEIWYYNLYEKIDLRYYISAYG